MDGIHAPNSHSNDLLAFITYPALAAGHLACQIDAISLGPNKRLTPTLSAAVLEG